MNRIETLFYMNRIDNDATAIYSWAVIGIIVSGIGLATYNLRILQVGLAFWIVFAIAAMMENYKFRQAKIALAQAKPIKQITW